MASGREQPFAGPKAVTQGCKLGGETSRCRCLARAGPRTGAPGRRRSGPSSYLTRILPLAAGTFAVGTGLLVVQGILPEMARDLGVSVGVAGQ